MFHTTFCFIPFIYHLLLFEKKSVPSFILVDKLASFPSSKIAVKRILEAKHFSVVLFKSESFEGLRMILEMAAKGFPPAKCLA